MKPKEIFKDFESQLSWDFNEIADKDCVVCSWNSGLYPKNALVRRKKDEYYLLFMTNRNNNLLDILTTPKSAFYNIESVLERTSEHVEFIDEKLLQEFKECRVLNGI